MSELPPSWAWTTLEEIASTSSGGTPSRSRPDFYGGLIPWVKSGELNDGLVSEIEETITEDGLGNSSAKIFRSGTLCIALYGATVGKVGILAQDAATNQAVCGITSYAQIRTKYLFYFLRSQRSALIGLSVGGAQPNISQQIVRSTTVPVCASAEQDRIVAEIEKQFTRLDAATAALKRVQANLKRYRASVLKAACEGRLVPKEADLARKEGRDYEPAEKLLQRILREGRARWETDTLAKMIAAGKRPTDDRWRQKYKEPATPDTANLPELPEGWCWVSADQICSRITDGEHIQPPYRDSGRPLLTAKHVQDGWVDFREFGLIDDESFAKARARCAPARGDVLIVSVGATTGRTGIVREEPSFAIVRSVLLLRPIINSRYLLTWAQSPSCQDWIRSASGSTAQAHFYINDAKRMPIALAPESEQVRITDERDRMLSVVDALQAVLADKVKASASLRQAVLSSAFTGQLVPQDPNDEPASRLLERIRAERVESLKKTVAPKTARKRGQR